MAPREELADGGRLGRPGRLQGAVTQKGSPPEEPSGTPRARAESAARRSSENATTERREAPAFLATGTRQDGKTRCAARRSVPSAFRRGRKAAPRRRGKTTAYPGPQRIRAMTLACSPPPCGEGSGVGVEVSRDRSHPHPDTLRVSILPTRGRVKKKKPQGIQTMRVGFAGARRAIVMGNSEEA